DRFEDEVVGGLDPFAPDRLVLTDGLADNGVANERSTLDGPGFEPVRTPQLLGEDDAKRADRTRKIKLFPDHRPFFVATLSDRTWRRRDLRRPDRVEVGHEPGHSLRRRGDQALMPVADSHTLTGTPRPAVPRASWTFLSW